MISCDPLRSHENVAECLRQRVQELTTQLLGDGRYQPKSDTSIYESDCSSKGPVSDDKRVAFLLLTLQWQIAGWRAWGQGRGKMDGAASPL